MNEHFELNSDELETVFDCCRGMMVRFPAAIQAQLIQGVTNAVPMDQGDPYLHFWLTSADPQRLIDAEYKWNPAGAGPAPNQAARLTLTLSPAGQRCSTVGVNANEIDDTIDPAADHSGAPMIAIP